MDTTKWIYTALDPKLKAELLAGRHTEFPRLRQVFINGYASEAQEWAEEISLGKVVLPGRLWAQA